MHGQPSENKPFLFLTQTIIDRLDLKGNYKNATKKIKWFNVAIDQDFVPHTK